MERPKQLLIISEDTNLSSSLKQFFKEHGVTINSFTRMPSLAAEIRGKNPHAILIDAALASASGVDVLQQIKDLDVSLPVIVTVDTDDSARSLEALRGGAYSVLRKPFSSYEEIYHIVKNAIDHYVERLEALDLTTEMEKRYEHDKLNLLELDFVKSLQHMIGETEEAVSVFKNSFILLKNFLTFDIFAALVPQEGEIEIHLYPNVPFNQSVAEFIPRTLMKRMAGTPLSDQRFRLVLNGVVEAGESFPEDYKSVIVPLSTNEKTHGYAGIYRRLPFDHHEESVFKRVCSHISLTLEKVALFRQVKLSSMRDGLTGIYNHLSIVSKLEEEVARSLRYASNLAVIIFDIDNFKEVNDTFGHLAGDMVLKEVAQAFKQSVRSIDNVGRYGGEEFLIILPETDGVAAGLIGERLRKRINDENFLYENNIIRITLSGGVAVYREGMDASKLIKSADDNLYRAKRQGKNMVCYDRI